MRPSEYVSLGLKLEELERPKAAARQAAAGKANLPGAAKRVGVNDNDSVTARPRRTHDEVAKALGVSGATYLRASSPPLKGSRSWAPLEHALARVAPGGPTRRQRGRLLFIGGRKSPH